MSVVAVEEELGNALVVAVCTVTDEDIISLGSVGVGDGRSVGGAEGEGDTPKVEEGTVGVDIDCTSVVGAKTVLDVGR